jgi:hypothetical protein
MNVVFFGASSSCLGVTSVRLDGPRHGWNGEGARKAGA